MPPKKDFATAFGEALDQQLAKRGVRQSDLARAAGVSAAYINRLVKNTASPSPERCDIISDQLRLDDDERGKLHVAAARARGYRIP